MSETSAANSMVISVPNPLTSIPRGNLRTQSSTASTLLEWRDYRAVVGDVFWKSTHNKTQSVHLPREFLLAKRSFRSPIRASSEWDQKFARIPYRPHWRSLRLVRSKLPCVPILCRAGGVASHSVSRRRAGSEVCDLSLE